MAADTRSYGRFVEKTVIVTGAAGGIGRAAAVRFGSEGAQVVAVDLAASDLATTVRDVEATGAPVMAVPADVTSDDDVAGYVAAAIETFGRVDVLFNNAGIAGPVKPILEYSEAELQRVLDVNVMGVWRGIRAAAPAMADTGGGVIVNTASIAGLRGTPQIAGYGASKHAVVSITRTAAVELAPLGIRVNAVCPAPIETPMMREIEKGYGPDDPQAIHDGMIAQAPLGRYGEPEEVAALVAFLCSDEAAFISGSAYVIDGGWLAT